MYLKDKSIKLSIRLSKSDYKELHDDYDLFCLSHNCNFTFSEYLRRLLLMHRDIYVKKCNVV